MKEISGQRHYGRVVKATDLNYVMLMTLQQYLFHFVGTSSNLVGVVIFWFTTLVALFATQVEVRVYVVSWPDQVRPSPPGHEASEGRNIR